MTSVKKEPPVPSEESEALGIPASYSIIGFQTEVFKELINKFAWALGSTYRTAYSNQKTPTRQLAISIAKHVVSRQGYPEYLRK